MPRPAATAAARIPGGRAWEDDALSAQAGRGTRWCILGARTCHRAWHGFCWRIRGACTRCSHAHGQSGSGVGSTWGGGSRPGCDGRLLGTRDLRPS